MTFQAWKIKILHSMTFQVFHDQYKSCQFQLTGHVPYNIEQYDFESVTQENWNEKSECSQ